MHAGQLEAQVTERLDRPGAAVDPELLNVAVIVERPDPTGLDQRLQPGGGVQCGHRVIFHLETLGMEELHRTLHRPQLRVQGPGNEVQEVGADVLEHAAAGVAPGTKPAPLHRGHPVDTHEQRLADFAALDQLTRAAKLLAEALVQCDTEHAAAGGGAVQHAPAIGGARCHRLLAQHVAAGLEALDGVIGMQVHGGSDAHQPGPLALQHRAQVVIRAATPLCRRRGGALRIGIHQCGQLHLGMGCVPGNVIVHTGPATPHHRGPQPFLTTHRGC